MPDPRTIEVVARRIDDGTRWELEAVDIPGARVEVIDLVDGSVTIRTALAERLGEDPEELAVRILLA